MSSSRTARQGTGSVSPSGGGVRTLDDSPGPPLGRPFGDGFGWSGGDGRGLNGTATPTRSSPRWECRYTGKVRYLYLAGPRGFSHSSWTATGEATRGSLRLFRASGGDVNGDGFSMSPSAHYVNNSRRGRLTSTWRVFGLSGLRPGRRREARTTASAGPCDPGDVKRTAIPTWPSGVSEQRRHGKGLPLFRGASGLSANRRPGRWGAANDLFVCPSRRRAT